LSNNILGNSHSTNTSSKLSTQLVEEARQEVLRYFNAEDYYCIFTSNASNVLKIVGESYPFSPSARFMLLSDNHNSVNGIREFCIAKGGNLLYAPIYHDDLRMDEAFIERELCKPGEYEEKLFAFPAQSNVSGVKHDLKWISFAQEHGWDVLLDAAAFVPSSPLDLKKYPVDFVNISFYKIMGYPTGIGCLLVKKSKFNKLRKPWFAGGTVSFVSVNALHHSLIESHERFEDGTIDYLGLPALKIGFEYIQSIGIQRIQERVISLRKYIYDALIQLKHSNGNPLVSISGPSDNENVDGTLILELYNSNGVRYDFEAIEELANKQTISLRSGCFCNPGLDEANSCLTAEELAKFFSVKGGGTYHEMNLFFGKMRGSTRISFGIATVQRDLDTFVSFVKSFIDK
jgi:molybdenum cofactor sulfurtransferase